MIMSANWLTSIKSSQRADRVLKYLPRGDRRLAEPAGGDLGVLLR